jgi:hypothetical protein
LLPITANDEDDDDDDDDFVIIEVAINFSHLQKNVFYSFKVPEAMDEKGKS